MHCIICGPSKTVRRCDKATHYQLCNKCMKIFYGDMKCISCGEIQTCRKTFIPTTKRCLKCKCRWCGSPWKWNDISGFSCALGDCHMCVEHLYPEYILNTSTL